MSDSSPVVAPMRAQVLSPVRQPVVALAAYAGKQLLHTFVWIIGGTGLAWVLVWLKARAEASATPWFLAWVRGSLLEVWSQDSMEISAAVAGMANTLFRVMLALVMAGAVSALIGWKTSRDPHSRRWDILDSVLGVLGGLPLFFLCFLVEGSGSGVGRTSMNPGWFICAAAIAILAWGEGNGTLWVRTFRQQFGRLRRAPHIIAAQARGLTIRRRIWRDMAGVLVESGGSRAVVLLSGAAIVEYILGLNTGIGYLTINEFTASAPSYPALAAQTLVLVSVAAVLRRVDAVTRDWLRRTGAVPS
jgi:ABC-type dipeptide/oligopeptide/nickel transport system permease component